jgi:hypothetical protein
LHAQPVFRQEFPQPVTVGLSEPLQAAEQLPGPQVSVVDVSQALLLLPQANEQAPPPVQFMTSALHD